MQASFNHSFTVKFRNELQKNLELNLPSNPLPHFANIESSVIQLYIKVIQSQSYLLYMSTRECSDADSTVPLKLRPYGAIEILLLLLFFMPTSTKPRAWKLSKNNGCDDSLFGVHCVEEGDRIPLLLQSYGQALKQENCFLVSWVMTVVRLPIRVFLVLGLFSF